MQYFNISWIRFQVQTEVLIYFFILLFILNGGFFVKKIFIALVAVVVVAASAFGAVTIKKSISEKSNLKINEKSSLSEIIEFYNRSVKNSKDYKDFNLDVNTSVQLDEISSSSTFLNEMLSAIMGYNVGEEMKRRIFLLKMVQMPIIRRKHHAIPFSLQIHILKASMNRFCF